MKLSVPGKTFLVGEYLALAGGPSLILCTGPRFVLNTSSKHSQAAGATRENLFAEQSPAGRLLARSGFADTASWSFEDPHEGLGGLGASSAQFALTFAAIHGASAAKDSSRLLEEYRSCAWDGRGVPPSGADVVAQLNGRLAEFDGRDFRTRVWEWPFPDLSFTLVRTGIKLATHEHLRDGRAGVPEESLRPLVDDVRTALEARDARRFAVGVQRYGERLSASGWLAEASRLILEEVRSADRAENFGLRAAKGCGAMGADIVLFVHERSEAERLRAFCGSKGWRVCGTENELSEGLRVED